MYLDLMDTLRSPGNVAEKQLDVPPTTLADVELVEPVRGVVRAVNARQNIVVSGQATTAVAMECSRCLRQYAQPLELEFEAVAPLSFFQAQLGGETDEESEPDDEMAALFDAHTVDVLELIRQAVVLQWPIQPLCSEDCPGLPEAVQYAATEDERWSALAAWQAVKGGLAGADLSEADLAEAGLADGVTGEGGVAARTDNGKHEVPDVSDVEDREKGINQNGSA